MNPPIKYIRVTYAIIYYIIAIYIIYEPLCVIYAKKIVKNPRYGTKFNMNHDRIS
jgi:hypothetical protein